MQLGDEVECSVDTGGNAGREDNLSVVDNPHILKNIRGRSIHLEFRKGSTMRGRMQPVQKAGLGKQQGARAHGQNPLSLASMLANEIQN